MWNCGTRSVPTTDRRLEYDYRHILFYQLTDQAVCLARKMYNMIGLRSWMALLLAVIECVIQLPVLISFSLVLQRVHCVRVSTLYCLGILGMLG